jgi:hypothetical protein
VLAGARKSAWDDAGAGDLRGKLWERSAILPASTYLELQNLVRGQGASGIVTSSAGRAAPYNTKDQHSLRAAPVEGGGEGGGSIEGRGMNAQCKARCDTSQKAQCDTHRMQRGLETVVLEMIRCPDSVTVRVCDRACSCVCVCSCVSEPFAYAVVPMVVSVLSRGCT